MNILRPLPVAAAAALTLAGACAVAGVPYPTAKTPRGQDAGPMAAHVGERPTTVTVALKLRDVDAAESLLAAIHDPRSASYRKFLTPEQFRERFAPTPAEVERVSNSLRRRGLAVERATTTTLHVTGTPSALEQAFSTQLHTFEVPAHDRHAGYAFHAPTSAPQMPEETATLVHGVLGLNGRPHYHPNFRRTPAKLGRVRIDAAASPAAAGGNTPGSWTVTDFARYYGVTPLYHQGLQGHGRTMGIVTLASFTPSDAFAYWQAVGLQTDPKRLSIVDIDGGPGAPSDDSGSGETTLDVEQAGGVAPAAKIIVYQAPNTNQGFVDAFAAAIDSNRAETLSVSWGSWEWFNTAENGPVADPFTGETVSGLRAMHELFLQAALQGQTLIAASGDSGAYDVNGSQDGNGVPILPPNYSLALSVDSPASDPFITAAGGTTLAGKQTFTLSDGRPFVVDVKEERAWGWDYLDPLCQALGLTPIDCGIFPVGSGGGVSVMFRQPFYQWGLPGVHRSQPKQALVDYTGSTPQTVYALPAHFAGRNLPDISMNADPDTGYTVYYTSDRNGFTIETFDGGTSFVSPQLNGVAALLGESLHGRLGLLNVPLYFVARTGGYRGPNAPLNAITQGRNEFYRATNGYNPATGLGTLNAAAFVRALKQLSTN